MKKMDYNEFKAYYVNAANQHGAGIKIIRDSKTYLLYLHLFVERFFMQKYLKNNISRSEMKLMEMDKHISLAIDTWLKYENNIALSLVFVGANYALMHLEGIKKDAYNVALEIYAGTNTDFYFEETEVLNMFKDNAKIEMEKILEKVPDIIITKHAHDLDSEFLLKKTTVKQIRKALTKELDSSIMFDMKDGYNNYLNHLRQKELKQIAKQAGVEAARGEMA